MTSGDQASIALAILLTLVILIIAKKSTKNGSDKEKSINNVYFLGVRIASTIIFGLILIVMLSSFRPSEALGGIVIVVLIVFIVPTWFLLGSKKYLMEVEEQHIPHETPNYWELSPWIVSEEKIRDYLDRANEEQKEADSEVKNELKDNSESEKAQPEDKSVTGKRKHPRRMVR